ncbi:IS66 family insertion sequence element accessory protein TnpB [Mesorhizobium sp. M0323]|uniref:IS66 family insertion sequence element accessory protein TnpB n=1 Tax=Mesorhizobium sp. M0323 TaxID=2956938 RepID=UPI003336A15D
MQPGEHLRWSDAHAGHSSGKGTAVITSGARVWLSMGHTDMRRGMQGLVLLLQQHLKRHPHGGDLYVFRGRAGSLVKIIWHDGIGPLHLAQAKDRAVSLTSAQLACLLDGIDWRNPQYSWRPASAGYEDFLTPKRHFSVAPRVRC